MTDFAKEMVAEEGIDRDLELENLLFIKEQTTKKMDEVKHNKNETESSQSTGRKNTSTNITPKNTRSSGKTRNITPSTPSATPGSPKGLWKTTRRRIQKKYGLSYPQNYGCKVCGQLLPSKVL